MHWIQDNFVFGQNSKSLLVFRNGPVRSFGTFYATFEKQNGDFFIPSVKKWMSKTEKMRKWPKTANFEHILVFLSDQSVLPQLRPGCKVVFLIIFADYDGWEPKKSRNNAQ